MFPILVWPKLIVGELKKKQILHSFMTSVTLLCQNESFYKAWRFCGGINVWYTNQPHFTKLWPKKRILVIPSSIAFCERAYLNQMLSRSHLRPSLIGHFGYSNTSIFMRDRVGENGLEGNIWRMAWHEKPKKFWFGAKLVRSSNFYVYILENNVILIFNLVSKIKIFSTHHLRNSFLCCPSNR